MRLKSLLFLLGFSMLPFQITLASGKSAVKAGEIVYHKQFQRCAVVQKQNEDGSYTLKLSPISDRSFTEIHTRLMGIVLPVEFEKARTTKDCNTSLCQGTEVIITSPHRWVSAKGMQKWDDRPRWATVQSTFPSGAVMVSFQDDPSGRTYCFSPSELTVADTSGSPAKATQVSGAR